MRAVHDALHRAAPCRRAWSCSPGTLDHRRFTIPLTFRRRYATTLDLHFGQPLHETHPHLLRYGELTPGITAVEYAERRLRLARDLPANSVAVLSASDVKTRSGAVFYKFHQEPNFFYLTGFNEPTALAIIHKRAHSAVDHVFHLFVRPKDPFREKWEGSRSGVEAAQEAFNADEAGDINDVTNLLPEILSGAAHVFTNILLEAKDHTALRKISGDTDPHDSQRIREVLRLSNAKPLTPYMNELRVCKSEAEIANMRKTGQASARGFTEAMKKEWATEQGLEGFLEYQFKKNGCEQSAYVPVIAGGKNANQIHYVRNDAELKSGQLVTADAGGEYGGYVADITRTWPVNGKFTVAQRDMYEMVLSVQRSCIAQCNEKADVSLDRLHAVAEAGLKEGLTSLGFRLPGKAMDALFPHHLGHFVGLDVHDCPGYPRSGRLRNGQCITVEPGIYVDDDERWPRHFRGMGIRIEDSVCVQEDTCVVLTTEAVKEAIDIEALRNQTHK